MREDRARSRLRLLFCGADELAESVVPLERMRRDDKSVYARVVGQGDLDGHLCPAGAPPLIEHVSDGLSGEGTTAMRVGERRVELSGTILVKQAKQPGGSAAQVSTVFGDLSKKGLGCWATSKQSIAPAMLAALAFVHEERSQVGFVFDLLAHAPGT